MDNIDIRKKCRLCLHDKLVQVFELPLTPPGELLKSTKNESNPVPIPIDLYQCEKCGHVQVIHIPPPQSIFGPQYTFMTRDNPLLVKHFESSVDYFLDNYSSDIDFSLEIGSNDGVFLEIIRDKTRCKVLGVDPSLEPVSVAEKHNIDTIVDFFTPDLAKKIVDNYGNPDLVIANNVFAHMDDLRSVMEGISFLLQSNDYFMFEVSYLKDVVEKYLVGTIIHEHLSVHSVYSLIPFLNEFGFNLIGVKYVKNIQGGAIVGVAQKDSIVRTPSSVMKLVEEERKVGITDVKGMKEFNKKFHGSIEKFSALIHNYINGKKVIGVGAARSASLIIDLLNLRDNISYIVDDSSLKIGKYMPIGNIPIVKFDERIKDENTQIYIVLGWAQTKRIVEKILEFTARCTIITVYPKFEIKEYQ